MEIGLVGLGRADYARRLLAMMRAEFGGHPIPRAQ
jgi:6-phosphogluconate dehydrogenase (decarboxylating)